MSLVAQIPKTAIVLPRGHKVISTSPLILQKIKSGGKRFKLSKKTRDRISLAARKFKLPILTIGAQLPWALPLMGSIQRFGGAALSGDMAAQRFIANQITLPFFGVGQFSDGTTFFAPKEMARGLLPNLMVFAINRSGILRATNQKLAKSRLPISLS